MRGSPRTGEPAKTCVNLVKNMSTYCHLYWLVGDPLQIVFEFLFGDGPGWLAQNQKK
jgi:hypothetical protein